ncbi:hypothetical protein KQH90_01960 [Anaerosalibacter bizertensis]|uniref:hypothetical protein n=1 Tax=Anaerosalibacter bizertensis TaxID=932217 RepID=UPI001C0EDB6B|nr:hypothetical protein [Anaerosalibacter bizertensis]MBU5292802.1 hypothetical protein [Anaerosalibacter bizertensis]
MNYKKIKLIKKKEKIKHAVDILEECAEILYQECKDTERSPELQICATIFVLKEEIEIMEGKINELR